MKTSLGTEVDIGADHIVLDGFPALREMGTAPPPSFRPMSIMSTVAHLSYCSALVDIHKTSVVNSAIVDVLMTLFVADDGRPIMAEGDAANVKGMLVM